MLFLINQHKPLSTLDLKGIRSYVNNKKRNFVNKLTKIASNVLYYMFVYDSQKMSRLFVLFSLQGQYLDPDPETSFFLNR